MQWHKFVIFKRPGLHFTGFYTIFNLRDGEVILNHVLMKLLCIATQTLFPVLSCHVLRTALEISFKTSETKLLGDRLEWMNLNNKEFQKSKEVLRNLIHTDQNWILQ